MCVSGFGIRDSGIGNRESGIGNRESGIGNRQANMADRLMGFADPRINGRDTDSMAAQRLAPHDLHRPLADHRWMPRHAL
ncbi:hypothetical protein XspCFBP7912_06280 [Xanthomonas sp. CFBP 7912]|nr:hypothetical protein XspCFBP7912_06280 [Xanthomonas sp. CFBP 7912]